MLVLVTDGEDRAALATCRALAAAGHRVDVAAGRRPAAAHWSRHCSRRLFTPPSLDPDRFIDALGPVLATTPYDAVVPSTDAALLALSRGREHLPDPRVLHLPDDETVTRCLDKALLVDEARRLGLVAPASERCVDAEAAEAAATAFGYPVIVKPLRSVVPADGGARRVSAQLARDTGELAKALRMAGRPLLVQRFHRNARVLSVAGVATESGLAAVVATRWSRRWPPPDGAAAFAETVAVPQTVEDLVETLVRSLGWRGIFELELLEVDGGTAPIDFNPRPFGWMTLATRAGANLPAVWLESIGGDGSPRVCARPGVRYRWEEGELKHLIWQVRRRQLGAAAAVLRPHRQVAHACFERTDPAPLGAALLDVALRTARGASPGSH